MDAFPRPLFRYSPRLDWNARLRLAAAFDDVDTIRSALRLKADPTTPGPEGRCAWEIVVQNQNLRSLEFLLQSRDEQPLPDHLAHLALEFGFHQGAQILMQHGLQANHSDPSPATLEEMGQILDQLEATGTALGVERDEDGLIPIPDDGVLPGLPIQAGSPEVLRQTLLDAGFSPADPEVTHLVDMVEASPFVVVFHSETLAPYIVVSPQASQRLFPALAPRQSEPDQPAEQPRKPRLH